jgi:hypothetical protein
MEILLAVFTDSQDVVGISRGGIGKSARRGDGSEICAPLCRKAIIGCFTVSYLGQIWPIFDLIFD